MHIVIRHTLRFYVPPGTGRGVQHLLLSPLDCPSQTVTAWSIEVEGMERSEAFTDAFGNRAILVTQARAPERLAIAVAGTVETRDTSGVVGRMPDDPVQGVFLRVTPLTRSPVTVHGKFRGQAELPDDRIALLHGLMERLGEMFDYAAEDGGSEREAGERRSLTSPEMAHAFVGAARALGIPARYVTGYVAGLDDASTAFHAWAEAYDDALGWVGFDAAHGICPTDRYVRVAVGLDAAGTRPVRSVPPVAELTASEAVASVEAASKPPQSQTQSQ